MENWDWEAVCDSEIFREYVKAELHKETLNKQSFADELETKLDKELEVYAALEEFRANVNANPQLKEYILKCKTALKNNPDLAKTVDPKFLLGLELIDISEVE